MEGKFDLKIANNYKSEQIRIRLQNLWHSKWIEFFCGYTVSEFHLHMFVVSSCLLSILSDFDRFMFRSVWCRVVGVHYQFYRFDRRCWQRRLANTVDIIHWHHLQHRPHHCQRRVQLWTGSSPVSVPVRRVPPIDVWWCCAAHGFHRRAKPTGNINPVTTEHHVWPVSWQTWWSKSNVRSVTALCCTASSCSMAICRMPSACLRVCMTSLLSAAFFCFVTPREKWYTFSFDAF